MMHNQPEARPKAKRLADYIAGDTTQDINAEIAQELRRLHAENERLRAEAQNSKEAWDALTDHAEKVRAENERLRAAADLVRAQALEDAARELDSDWPADTIEERSYRKQYAKLIRALKDTQ